MKARLLFPAADLDLKAELPPGHQDLISDLELDTLLDAMADGDGFLREISARVLLTPVTSTAVIRYRQQVLADCLARPGLIRQLYGIAVDALTARRGVWGIPGSRYPAAILSAAVSQLEVLIIRLRQLRQLADAQAAAVSSAGLSGLFASLQRDLDDEYFDTLARHLRELRFRDGVPVSAGLDRDNSAAGLVLRGRGTRRGWRERVGLGRRSVYSFSIAPRDEAGAQALSDLTSRGINQVASAAARSADHVTSYFTMLRAELAFYVGCLNLHEQLTARRVPAEFPDPVALTAGSAPQLRCEDLRDACLALRTEPVTGNTADTKGRPVVIITGANSGGKSTFLRSVGLAQLMTQCGLFVTAEAFSSTVCPAVFTHFTREEDPELVSGRLDAELRRMSDIAGHLTAGCLVLFNESFAATNEREGSEIGRQVVRALTEAGVRVCFVTHLFDFADSFRRDRPDSTLFLRAPRQPGGQRTFRLDVAGPLPTSFGPDLYERSGWLGEQDSSEG